MIKRFEKEISRCLKNECYIAALTLSVILPDICGKAEYPSKKVGDRYKDWFKKYVKDYAKLYMTPDIAYSLRCKLLHEANPTVKKETVKNLLFS